ncbi:MAG: hypothetical protein CM15mP18_3470 [Methanobacteriota archaeon]|nr:MAG: hypothetical protein CM15mP18_3470 [Euryarchaeota archaeon]
MIHGSDGEDTAGAELALWFPEGVMEGPKTASAGSTNDRVKGDV